ncbi:phenylalanine--tRNA ligase subunit beta, partial [Candidatus Falkowbacteria bacterium RBG_13_39_14]
EVEGVERQGKYLKNVVVGKIEEIKKHPNADKLKICIVDVGEKKDLQIICGGINLREKMHVAVAKIGAKVKWHGEEEVTMEKVKIRGEESNGMICTVAELGLEGSFEQKDSAEIMDLDKLIEISAKGGSASGGRNWKFEIGHNLSEVLGLDDVIFDIDNKSITNRPDLWSHYGIAREIAAIYGLKLAHGKIPPIPPFKKGGETTPYPPIPPLKKGEAEFIADIKVDVKDPDLCPRYMAVAMRGIKIEPSPEWLQKRLSAVGMRTINNIVDITNFVMLELGQPMHAFDVSKLKTNNSELEIIVRRAGGRDDRVSTTDNIITLDGVDRELDNTILVIADSEKPIAIAGVMGGENSEIDDNTTEIILESANFEKVNNRKTASKLGLRTEASARYEKGLDPKLCEQALSRCVELIREVIPGVAISSDVVDVGAGPSACPFIEISLDYIRKKMGVAIEEKRVAEILVSLGFEVDRDAINRVSITDKIFKITVPSWRATGDISIPDDIIEEIARIYGYDDIEPRMPKVFLEPPLENKERSLERRVKNILSFSFGMNEASNYSFVNEKQLENLGIREKCVRLANPISAEHTLLRPSLIPNLLNNVKDNLRYFDEFAIFEIGSIFRDEASDIERRSNFQPACAMPAHAGGRETAAGQKSKIINLKSKIDNCLPWQEKFIAGIVVMGKDGIPFFKAKEAAIGLLRELGVEFNIEQSGLDLAWSHPARSAIIRALTHPNTSQEGKLESVEIGYITELNPVIAEEIGIKNARVGVFNLSLKALLEFAKDDKKYKSLPKFPQIIRDLAVVVDKKILYKDISDLINKTDKLITKVELFDIFENEKLGADKKSMAFHITFYDPEKTLTDAEADGVFKKIVSGLDKKFGAGIRK